MRVPGQSPNRHWMKRRTGELAFASLLSLSQQSTVARGYVILCITQKWLTREGTDF